MERLVLTDKSTDMKRTHSKTRVYISERGMVSIMVTMIMMMVITLIILGFASVVRRNQREALDRQLSTQAFYAAETGINDAIAAVKNKTPADIYTNNAYQTQCSGPGSLMSTGGWPSPTIGTAGNNVAYTCLLVDPNPPTVQTTVNLGAAKSLPLTLNGSSGGLKFSWPATGASNSPALCPGTFVPSTTWSPGCPYGALRVELYRSNGALDPATMENNTVNSFLVPHNGGGGGSVGITFGSPSQSTYVTLASCSVTDCHATLNGVPDGTYYVRLTSVYADAGKVTISCGAGCTITGSQIMIDVTGKAQDVLRRVQVRVPIDANGIPLPVNALQSEDGICKRFGITGSGASAVPDQNASPPLCTP